MFLCVCLLSLCLCVSTSVYLCDFKNVCIFVRGHCFMDSLLWHLTLPGGPGFLDETPLEWPYSQRAGGKTSLFWKYEILKPDTETRAISLHVYLCALLSNWKIQISMSIRRMNTGIKNSTQVLGVKPLQGVWYTVPRGWDSKLPTMGKWYSARPGGIRAGVNSKLHEKGLFLNLKLN